MVQFVDAGFAGDLTDSKSTSGGLLALVGPHTFVPLSWTCRKQACVSHSTTEAEMVAAFLGMSQEGLPLKDLVSAMRGVKDDNVPCYFGEDNTATIQVIRAGYSPKLRYLNRTHRINVGLLYEEVAER